MTNPTSGNSFTDLLNSVTQTTNTDPTPKMNQHGQVDIYGIGQNSGESFPIGTSSYGGDHGDPVNGPGGHETFINKPSTAVDTTTTDDYIKTLIKLSQTNPDQFTAIQQGLYQSGFYGAATAAEVGFGRWNQKTKDALIGASGALTNFLEVYKSGGTADTFNEWLGKQAALAAADPNSPGNKPGSVRAPLTLTDPSTITAAGDQAGSALLGHALQPGQDQQLVNQFQGNEQSQYNNAVPGGATTTSQNPSDVARQFVVQNNLPEFAAHQAEGYMNTFANMFLGGASARANTGVADVAVPTK